MKQEITNYILALLFLIGLSGVYLLFSKPTADEAPQAQTISRRNAYNICKDVCQGNNKILLSVLNDKHIFGDKGTYEALVEGIDGCCDKDCNTKINP